MNTFALITYGAGLASVAAMLLATAHMLTLLGSWLVSNITRLLGGLAVCVAFFAFCNAFIGSFEPTSAPHTVTHSTRTTSEAATVACRQHRGVSSINDDGWTPSSAICRDGTALDLAAFASVRRTDAAARLAAWNVEHDQRVARADKAATIVAVSLGVFTGMLVLAFGRALVLDRREREERRQRKGVITA